MKTYSDLKIYQKAYNLTLDVYRITAKWPSVEIFGLTSQVRRSAHSVDSNICEGASRRSSPDCIRFMNAAYASLQETQNHLRLAKDLGYLEHALFNDFTTRISELSRMINGFISSCRLFPY